LDVCNKTLRGILFIVSDLYRGNNNKGSYITKRIYIRFSSE
jgi:hypothetical protein